MTGYLAACLRWRLERHRARRGVYYADLDYRRSADPWRLQRLVRAQTHLRRIEWNPPHHGHL